MMDFAQMERHYRILEVIDLYERILSQFDADLRSRQLDGVSHSGYHADRYGERLVKKEESMEKLRRLRELATAQTPVVEETIMRAAAGGGRAAVKVELILRARYQSGRSWSEIAALLHQKSAAQIRNLVLQRLEKAKEEQRG